MIRAVAWMTAGLTRAEKLPDFGEWVSGEQKKKQLTPEEIEEKRAERAEVIAQLEAFKAARKEDGHTSR